MMQQSSVLGIGIDSVEIDRIQKIAQKHGEIFLHHIFTKQELEYCFSQKNPLPSLAARFAAKEAVSKAFGCGIGKKLSWKSISTQNDELGQPEVVLSPQSSHVLQQLGGTKVLLSLTHTQTLAQAIALII